MTSAVINVAKDFSKMASVGLSKHGLYSGEGFRRYCLTPALKNNDWVIVNFNDMLTLGSSFLKEAFEGLVTKEGFTKEQLHDKLHIDFRLDSYVREIWGYIDQANIAKFPMNDLAIRTLKATQSLYFERTKPYSRSVSSAKVVHYDDYSIFFYFDPITTPNEPILDLLDKYALISFSICTARRKETYEWAYQYDACILHTKIIIDPSGIDPLETVSAKKILNIGDALGALNAFIINTKEKTWFPKSKYALTSFNFTTTI